MEQQAQITDVEGKVNELMQGKTPASPVPGQTPSMIEEARQLKDQLTKLKQDITSEREKLDRVHAQAMLGGRSVLGEVKEKTKEEVAQQRAKDILAIYGK